jgi:hypothetical protein
MLSAIFLPRWWEYIDRLKLAVSKEQPLIGTITGCVLDSVHILAVFRHDYTSVLICCDQRMSDTNILWNRLCSTEHQDLVVGGRPAYSDIKV